VRPWLRRVAIAACIVLTPIAIWTAWDYVEARRLAAVVNAVKARGEPVTTRSKPAEDVSSRDNAARYYVAAGALMDGTGLYGATGLFSRLDRAGTDERSLAGDIKKFLDSNSKAEELLSTATDLEFRGFRPGFDDNFRLGQLYLLGRLADLRTLDRAMLHDGERAARAIVEQMRIVRALGWSERPYGFDLGGFAADAARRASVQVPRVLSIGATTAALERLQRSLQDVDIDSAIEQEILSERALLLETYWNEPNGWYAAPGYGFGNPTGPFFYLLRPWIAHRVVRQTQLLEEFLNTARRPWPEKLQLEAPTESEIAATRSRRTILPKLSDWNIGNPNINRYVNARRTERTATTLALVRSALAATAVARFRLAHAGELPRTLEELVPAFLPNVPVDPYSGKPLLYAHDGAHFAVYSDGTNQRDDGGKDLNATSGRRWGVYSVTSAPLDIGVEVSTAPAGAVVPVSPPISAPGRR
jgi:hypothetical protein